MVEFKLQQRQADQRRRGVQYLQDALKFMQETKGHLEHAKGLFQEGDRQDIANDIQMIIEAIAWEHECVEGRIAEFDEE